MPSLKQSHLLPIAADKEIKQLTVFERNYPSGRLNNIEVDCGVDLGDLEVEVYDLREFFSDSIVLERLASIEKLIVYGQNDTVVDFELAKFDRLAHLELYNLLFVNPNILMSFRLRHLVLNRASHLMASDKHLTDFGGSKPVEVFTSGLDNLRSENIKYLAFSLSFGTRAFDYLLERGLLQMIERLYILPADLSSLIHLSDNYPTLKRIDLACEESLLNQLTNQLKSDGNLLKILNELRKDLSVFVGGVPLRAKTAKRIVDAIGVNSLGFNSIRFDSIGANSTQSLVLKEEFLISDNPGCSGFRQLYRELSFFFKFLVKEVNDCRKIKFYVDLRTARYGDCGFLHRLSELRQVSIKCWLDLDQKTYAEIIERLKFHEKKITYLAFELWNYFDLSFVLQYRELQQLALRTAHPISQDTILELLIDLEQLEYLDLFFPKPAELNAAGCLEFQNLVEDQLAASRFEAKGLKFTMKIINFAIPLVQCQLKNEQTMVTAARIWSVESKRRMLKMIQINKI